MSFVDKARATPEYILLCLWECLQVENLGHSAAVYEIPKNRLGQKYGGKRRALAVQIEELHTLKPIREEKEQDLKGFAELMDAVVVNLVDAK